MPGKLVLLVDPSDQRREKTAGLLASLSIRTIAVRDGKQALDVIEDRDLDLIFCYQDISGHSAAELCEYVHDFVLGFLPFVLMVKAEEAFPEQTRKKMGADGVLVVPMRDFQVSTLVSLFVQNAEYKRRISHLKEENAELHKSLREIFHPDAETKLHRFDLFKQVIAKEIKKARRYGFPLSLLLMAIDRYQELASWLNQGQREKLFGMLHQSVIHDVRDIDIPVLFAEQKILVVMPHTGFKGAAKVADRIRDRVAHIKPPQSLTKLSLSVSLAVSSTEGLAEPSFGKIVQMAMDGLREAEIKGGNLVVVCGTNAREPSPTADDLPSPDLGPRIFFL